MKLCIRYFLVLLILFLNVNLGFTQEGLYNFLNFTTANGLPSNQVKGLAEDKNGKVWITTSKGLAFYDGNHVYGVQLGASNNNFNIDLGKISIDKNGLMWIVTGNHGLICYDRKKPIKEAISTYGVVIDYKTHSHPELYEVYASRSGMIYYGGQETDLQMLNPITGEIRQIALPLAKRGKRATIYNISEDPNGILWIGSRYHGFFRYDPKTGISNAIDLKNKGENAVSSFAFRDNDVYALYYDHDLVKYNPLTREISTKLLAAEENVEFYDNTFHCMSYNADDEELTIGHVSKGLIVYDITSKKKKWISWKEICPTCETPFRANALLKTESGYWLGTSNGLFRYANSINNKMVFIPSVGEPIIQLFKIGQDPWYRTASTFGRLSKDLLKRESSYSLLGIKMSQMNIIGKRLYFSSYYDGLFYFDANTKGQVVQQLPIAGDKHGFEVADCNTVLQDTLGGRPILWIGTWNNGLYKYDLLDKTMDLINMGRGLPSNRIINMGKDAEGKVWLAMDGYGLLKMEKSNPISFIQYNQDSDPEGIPSNVIITFSRFTDSGMWFSSASSGLSRISKLGSKMNITYFPDKNLFPYNYINDIKQDFAGKLWLRSADGSMVFDPEGKYFRQLQPGRGILPSSILKTLDISFLNNQLVLCTDKGLITTAWKDISFVTDIAERPQISRFTIVNKDNSYRLYQGTGIDLLPNENNFAFTYASPNAQLYDYVYAYKLDGIDKEWVIAENDLQAVYTNITGGNYTFQVKVGDKYGNWSPYIASIDVKLHSRWFETLWFKVLSSFLLVCAIFSFFLYRLYQQRKINELQLIYNKNLKEELLANEIKIKEQAEILELEKQEKLEADFRNKLVESELKAIRSQMNPHFIFNVLNSIEAYVMEQDAKSASRLIHKFAALSRIVLENSQFELVSIVSEINLIKLYLELEQDRFEYSFSFHIDIDESLDTTTKKIPPMLVQPIVENAVHHGIRNLVDKKGHILVNLFQREQSIFIEVVDNGVGFDAETPPKSNMFKTTSFGLKGVENRLNLINEKFLIPVASLEIISKTRDEKEVTKVIIKLPAFDYDDSSF